MPSLSLQDRRTLMGWQDRQCEKCLQFFYKNYCRECDEFFLECDCPPAEHVGHRTY